MERSYDSYDYGSIPSQLVDGNGTRAVNSQDVQDIIIIRFFEF